MKRRQNILIIILIILIFWNLPKRYVKKEMLVVADFDETITVRDTIDILAQLPYKLHKHERDWKYFQDTYMDNYMKVINDLTKQRKLPLLDNDENISWEIKYQDGLKNIELYSINLLQREKLFNDISLNDLKQFVINDPVCQNLIKPKFNEFLKKYLSNASRKFEILSINWSKEFIKYMIDPNDEFTFPISCNNLQMNSSDLKWDGNFDQKIMTGSDKRRYLLDIVSKDKDIWYIGDSQTDLLSLLLPQVNGIIMMNSKTQLDKLVTLLSGSASLNRKDYLEFLENDNIKSLLWYKKDETHGLYLVKDWNIIEKIVIPVSK
ncbi:hypothetical protein TBLA_0C01080 [Henningerozyma blattae CBS 6284]|uniref:Uncharacterized protein n=1 Tax=Henningerozyma blattae (strain ATCC 34711 / CBS 6284 / DSM 70876 / NBRC 10599 / NRRL Y-10934 / UCD 77-7) TaxID=1071380 RepID=I2H0M1_HENB6|nr:hypothetical protein TBLA_0C01080 [Tetrapisispora blattae CBS 6284]CCH59923.1 hypothetical protein TBLA_0C01080 [Tetrapisispora blattae CBS 6284]